MTESRQTVVLVSIALTAGVAAAAIGGLTQGVLDALLVGAPVLVVALAGLMMALRRRR